MATIEIHITQKPRVPRLSQSLMGNLLLHRSFGGLFAAGMDAAVAKEASSIRSKVRTSRPWRRLHYKAALHLRALAAEPTQPMSPAKWVMACAEAACQTRPPM